MTKDEFGKEYAALAHAVQSGVQVEMERMISKSHTPKHLRVGVNMAMCETAAVSRLLMEKGVITEDEYYAAILRTLREEKARYETRISASVGATVKLG